MKEKYLDYAAVWFAFAGVWPLADPGHHSDTPLSVFDIAVHVAAVIFLATRWKVVRRKEIS